MNDLFSNLEQSRKTKRSNVKKALGKEFKITDIPYELYETMFKTGSNEICNPPVTNTDIDYMFYTKDMNKFNSYLTNNDWTYGSGGYENSNFHSWKKDNFNLLLTEDINYYEKFEDATKLAKKLNLLVKKDRITLFNFVINGEIE